MNRRNTVVWLTVLLCALLLLSVPVVAIESDKYAIKWDVMASGAGPIQSTSYAINSSIGQAAIGFEISTSYQLGSGYWYGVTEQYAIYLPLILRSQ